MRGRLDGLDLAREVHALRSDIQLIITSGKMRRAESEIPDDGIVFSKPYNGETIAKLIALTQCAELTGQRRIEGHEVDNPIRQPWLV